LDQIEGFGYLAQHRVFGVLFAMYTGIGECFDNESNIFIFLWIMEQYIYLSVALSDAGRVTTWSGAWPERARSLLGVRAALAGGDAELRTRSELSSQGC
jgi:hypothetical protein